MTSSSFGLVNRGKSDEGVGFLAPAVCGSIALAVFVVVTQLLATTGAISLSATQLLTLWLVAAALMVLLWVTYMICRAYLTGAAPAEPHARDAGPERDEEWEPEEPEMVVPTSPEGGSKDVSLPSSGGPPGNGSPSNNGSVGEDEDAWAPPGELRYLAGTELPVSMAEVFPKGCCLQPDSITQDLKDKLAGQSAYQCRVVDRNPAKDRTHEAVVKILADRPPVPPTGKRFERVEFENLTITPYIIDRSPMRIRYLLRATGIHAAAALSERPDGEWTAFSNGQVKGGDQFPERPAIAR